MLTKHRDRLLARDIVTAFLHAVLKTADQQGFLSPEHFTVDGTLVEVWASQKSFRPTTEPRPGPPSTTATAAPIAP